MKFLPAQSELTILQWMWLLLYRSFCRLRVIFDQVVDIFKRWWSKYLLLRRFFASWSTWRFTRCYTRTRSRCDAGCVSTRADNATPWTGTWKANTTCRNTWHQREGPHMCKHRPLEGRIMYVWTSRKGTHTCKHVATRGLHIRDPCNTLVLNLLTHDRPRNKFHKK